MALESMFAEQLDDHLGELAHHYEHSDNLDKAVEYLGRAGTRAAQPDRLPVIGSEGQTIWVPRAIEGCWAGRGDSRLQYLGGCPNMFSGGTSPVKLRWCFRQMGDQPLTLVMAKG
jgi:hypothetical protein